ncbi:hypothetical protein ES705_16512 [subsurface metagenome]
MSDQLRPGLKNKSVMQRLHNNTKLLENNRSTKKSTCRSFLQIKNLAYYLEGDYRPGLNSVHEKTSDNVKYRT